MPNSDKISLIAWTDLQDALHSTFQVAQPSSNHSTIGLTNQDNSQKPVCA